MDLSLMFFITSVLAGKESTLVVTSQSCLFGSQELPRQSSPWGCGLCGAFPSWSKPPKWDMCWGLEEKQGQWHVRVRCWLKWWFGSQH